jgi:hypothetical protein
MKKWLFVFCLIVPTSLLAKDVSSIFSDVYGPTRTGCIQTSVTTTGNNRSAQLTGGRAYLLYCYDATTFMGEACRCVQGNVAIDVTALASSKVGQMIYAGQQIVVYAVADSADYVSCISVNATKKYDLCALN